MQQQLDFNKPQERFIMSQPKSGRNVWSRGTGKSFGIAMLIRLIVSTMPRSSWVIVGQTYKQILTRTLPSTISGMQTIGLTLDRDYFIKKKPPRALNFVRPYEPPLDYDHYMSFPNGTGFHLVSLDSGGGSSRGLNVDGIIADEGLLINKERYDTDVKATNRGNKRYFKHVPWHHGEFIFSSMPYNNQADWIFQMADYYKEDGYDFEALRNRIIELELEFIKHPDKAYRLSLWEKIYKLKLELKFYKSKAGFFYSEADIFDNIQNVGISYIEEQYRDMADFLFMTEILNKRPRGVEGGFYPDLSRAVHGYKDSFNNSYLNTFNEPTSADVAEIDCRMDGDLIRGVPLYLAVDWGDKINCASVGQHLKSQNEFRFLNALYVKRPKILDDLGEEFCRYYRHHNHKVVYFAYDHTGNSGVANSNLTYAQQFAKILQKHGWKVIMLTKGAAPTHQVKYLLWSRLLRQTDPGTPSIRFNIDNCQALFVSMEQAPAKEGRRGIEKDKGSERSNIPQEQATHLSDTADLLVGSLFAKLLKDRPQFVDIVY